jgi:hypothetical protein
MELRNPLKSYSPILEDNQSKSQTDVLADIPGDCIISEGPAYLILFLGPFRKTASVQTTEASPPVRGWGHLARRVSA